MLKFLLSFFKSDLDKILSGITSLIEELHAHAATKAQEASDHHADAAESTAKAVAAHAEVEKATAVAAKIGALVS